MRWISFLSVAYLMIALQMSIGHVVRWGDATPNLTLATLIFVALHAPADATLLAALVLGFGHDLTGSTLSQPMGFYTFSYAMLGLLLWQLRFYVYREHPLSHMSLGLGCSVALVVSLFLLGLLRWILHTPNPDAGVAFSTHLAAILLTTLATPVVVFVLRRFRKLFGFRRVEFSR